MLRNASQFSVGVEKEIRWIGMQPSRPIGSGNNVIRTQSHVQRGNDLGIAGSAGIVHGGSFQGEAVLEVSGLER